MNPEQSKEFTCIVADIFREEEYKVSIANDELPFDIIARKNGEAYYIITKVTSSIDNIPISIYKKSLINLMKHQHNECYIPVLVVAGLTDSTDRRKLIGYSNLKIIDVANLLYIVENNDDLKTRLVSFLPFSVNKVVPKSASLKLIHSSTVLMEIAYITILKRYVLGKIHLENLRQLVKIYLNIYLTMI